MVGPAHWRFGHVVVAEIQAHTFRAVFDRQKLTEGTEIVIRDVEKWQILYFRCFAELLEEFSNCLIGTTCCL